MSKHETKTNKQQIEKLQRLVDNTGNKDIRISIDIIKDILQDLCERVDEIEKAHEEDMDNTGSW